jgi:hypothetical protein
VERDGEEYPLLYHAKMPYVCCKRKLDNGEVVNIKFRGFNPESPYNDSMLASSSDPGMDIAMQVH